MVKRKSIPFEEEVKILLEKNLKGINFDEFIKLYQYEVDCLYADHLAALADGKKNKPKFIPYDRAVDTRIIEKRINNHLRQLTWTLVNLRELQYVQKEGQRKAGRERLFKELMPTSIEAGVPST